MSKDIGLIAEMRFQLAATLKGLIACKPPADNAPYDFIIDTGKKLIRVQVKSTAYIDNYKRYNFKLSTGTAGRSYTALEVHFFALYIIPLDCFYIIPQPLLRGYKTIKITDDGKYKAFKENWSFETGKIRYEVNERLSRQSNEDRKAMVLESLG